MRVMRGALVASSLVMGAVLGLGEAAELLDRASTVPFDVDRPVAAVASEHWPLPFEDQAA